MESCYETHSGDADRAGTPRLRGACRLSTRATSIQHATRRSRSMPHLPCHAVRRVAIIGGNRIPFARSNTAYSTASNQDMLTATLQGRDRQATTCMASAWAKSPAGAVHQALARLQPDPRVGAVLRPGGGNPRLRRAAWPAARASQPRSTSPTRLRSGQIDVRHRRRRRHHLGRADRA